MRNGFEHWVRLATAFRSSGIPEVDMDLPSETPHEGLEVGSSAARTLAGCGGGERGGHRGTAGR